MMIELNKDYYLRTVTLDDANDIFEFASDPLVTKYITWNHHKNLDETKWVIENLYFKKANDQFPTSHAIVDAKANKVIGIIDFTISGDPFPDYPQIGYFMNRDRWGKGIMSLALKELLKIGFNELGFEIIAITHNELNNQSKRVIEKNGFKYIKTYQKVYLPLKDIYINSCYYELRKDEYNDK